MRRYHALNVKTSSVINDLKTLNFKLVVDPNIYDENLGVSMSTVLEDNNMIAIVMRNSSVELSVPDNIEFTPPDYFDVLTYSQGTSIESYVAKKVFDNLSRSNVNNPILLNELEQEATDPIEDELTPESIILMEKNSGTVSQDK